jgi:hypothetical protein
MPRLVKAAARYVHAVGCCLYLCTLGVASPRHRSLLRSISDHFRQAPPVDTPGAEPPRRGLPTVSVLDVVPPPPAAHILEPLVVDGNVSLLELLILSQLARSLRPARLFEFGTFDGRTTLNLAYHSPEHARVYTLDLPRNGLTDARLPLASGDHKFIDKDSPGSRYKGHDLEHKIVQLYDDSAHFDAGELKRSIEFIFIDASHSYEYVMNDSLLAVGHLATENAILLWHDYRSWPGVTQALEELYESDPRFARMKHIEDTTLAYMFVGEDAPTPLARSGPPGRGQL